MFFSSLQQSITGSPLEVLAPFLETEFLHSITHGDHRRWRRLVTELPELDQPELAFGDVVQVGTAAQCDEKSAEQLRRILKEFIPWRKGPFSLYGIEIDSEWRSNLKWDRLSNAIAPLSGKSVLDVGSGNGYSSLRMYGAGAKLVIGLEPHIPYYGQFSAIKNYVRELPVHVLPLALEALPGPLPEFDTVFSMGVLYHRRSPLDHLLQLFDCLKPGGELVLESIVVDGDEGYSLVPSGRYSRMGNVWFIPSVPTLELWLRKCQFQNIRLVDISTTRTPEQRKTAWMPFDSLDESLDPDDSRKTVEGYPAPKRAVILCEKP